jgi:hypothetical protein
MHHFSLLSPRIFHKHPKNILEAQLKNSSNNLYYPQICYKILFSKVVLKGYLKKYVIYNPLRNILWVFKTTKDIEKSLITLL